HNNHLIWKDRKVADKYANNIDGLIELYEDFCTKLKKVYSNDEFPIILAGDHSSAAGTISGIRSSFPDKRLGVVWVDAHADLHSPYTSPTGNVHGMPLAVCLNEDNLENKKNNVSEHSIAKWETLKSIDNIVPKILKEDLVFIAVRDTEDEEDYLIAEKGIKNISVGELKLKGAEQIAEETLAYLDHCDLLYISFDVDSMDCNLISHGTGTPVPNGLDELEATTLLTELAKSDKLCCFEVTEINPTLDEKTNTMAETAFRVLDKVTDVIESNIEQY
ncbi:MAG: arginase, partial [Bacteroidia bacterium]